MKTTETRTDASLLLLCGLVVATPFTVQCGTIQYTYDRAGRLILADYGSDRTESFAYDNAGNTVASSSPGPGMSLAVVSGGKITFSWPTLPASFSLQSTPTLDVGVSWSAVPVVPVQVGSLWTATVPIGSGNLFYRLAK